MVSFAATSHINDAKSSLFTQKLFIVGCIIALFNKDFILSIKVVDFGLASY